MQAALQVLLIAWGVALAFLTVWRQNVHEVYKAQRRAMKAQLVQERQENARLLDRVAQLERDKDALRDVVRRQKQSLDTYKELLRGGHAGLPLEPTLAPPAEPKDVAPSPTLPALREAPAVHRIVAPAVQHVVTSKRRALAHRVADADAEAEDEESAVARPKGGPNRVVDAMGEWDVIYIGGAPPSRGSLERSAHAVFEPVRRKKARENLPEVDDCPMCAAFVDVLASETGQDRERLLKRCQKHRSTFPAPSTPPGDWCHLSVSVYLT